MSEKSIPLPPTLPQHLLATIGEYGMARTDGVSQAEIEARWLALIGGIKRYAVDYAISVVAQPPATSAPTTKDTGGER
ncbi:MAG: hypothetical protein GY747_10300 [Planctomycetes bacterium]|jgi:hypothetical protein|uniref:hypothetical protein n=1 Tax=Ralstonia TaxID=48736 RepID=UPI0010F53944|nr:hypothetical protein [Ralstonia insidiosa]MBX3770281.1 hypothetical protein [Ralstonia pickettii]MCP4093826.1 hypothetical protein [Planctomycetota bacterium]MDN9006644.1 hypothetical protein [Staphylococcus aureus]NOZ14810.1 hypothetical protein [Betaproteobacteria bacterium]MBA9854443.1 hypothetical protein [Ralstonia insidiosa]